MGQWGFFTWTGFRGGKDGVRTLDTMHKICECRLCTIWHKKVWCQRLIQPTNQPTNLVHRETHAKERAAQAQTRQQATWLTVSRLAGGPGQPGEKQHLKAWVGVRWLGQAHTGRSLRNAFDRPATPEQAPGPSFGSQGEIKSKQPRMGGQGVEMNSMARSDEACGKQARTCRLVKFGGLRRRPSRTPRLSSASRVSHRRCRVVISTVASSHSYPRSTVRILICSVRHYWAAFPHRPLREAHPGREIASPPRLSQFWVPSTGLTGNRVRSHCHPLTTTQTLSIVSSSSCICQVP